MSIPDSRGTELLGKRLEELKAARRSTMSEEQHLKLIERLELQAQTNLIGYRTKVLLLALLGHGHIYFVLLFGLAFLALSVYLPFHYHEANILFSWLILAIIFSLSLVTSSLYFRIPEPAGFKLAEDDAPVLFNEVEHIQKRLGAPKIDEIRLTGEFDAFVVQVPRLGMLGFRKHVLVLGLPLLYGLPLEGIRFVIAHEIGHLAASHDRIDRFIYRTRLTCQRLVENLAHKKRSIAGYIVSVFMDRYLSYFLAYSIVLARIEEYEADFDSARVVGKEQAARGLLALELVARHLLEEFWGPLRKEAGESPWPPKDIYHRMAAFLEKGLPPQNIPRWLNEINREQTGLLDTHPCTRERVAALGYRLESLDPPTTWERPTLLGENCWSIIEKLNEDWYINNMDDWKTLHRDFQEAREELKIFEAKELSRLDSDEILIHALLVEQIEGEERSLSLFMDLLKKYPEKAAFHYHTGRILIKRGERSGILYLQKAMELDSDVVLPACELIINFLLASGAEAEAQPYINRYREQKKIVEKKPEERDNQDLVEQHVPHRAPIVTASEMEKAAAEGAAAFSGPAVEENMFTRTARAEEKGTEPPVDGIEPVPPDERKSPEVVPSRWAGDPEPAREAVVKAENVRISTGNITSYDGWDYELAALELHKSLGPHVAEGRYAVALVKVTNKADGERELGWFFTAVDQDEKIYKFDSRASLAHHHEFRRGAWHLEKIEPSSSAIIPIAFDIPESATRLTIYPTEALEGRSRGRAEHSRSRIYLP